MVTFQDKFNRANTSLHGSNGWQVVDSADASTALTLVDNYVRNTSTGTNGYAFQETTLPTTANQEVSGWFTAYAQNSSATVRLGTAGQYNATFASVEFGVYLQFEWKANGEREVSLIHNVGSDGGATELASLTLIDNAGVLQPGWDGFLIDNGSIGTLQELRLIITETNQGLKLAGYVNNQNDDRPTIEAYARSDIVSPDATNLYAYWWFALLADGSTEPHTVCTEFSARDYVLGGRTTADRKESTQRADQPTLRELRDRVRRRYTGSTDADLTDQDLDHFINDEVENIINILGDSAWFLFRQEELTSSVDAEGFWTLPDYVERLQWLERKGQKVSAWWVFSHMDDNGNIVIRLNTEREPDNTTYIAQYLQRWERMSAEDDQCPVPRKHTETVVLAACRSLAQTRERSQALHQSYDSLFRERMALLSKEMSRHYAQRKIRLRSRRRATAPGFVTPYRRY